MDIMKESTLKSIADNLQMQNALLHAIAGAEPGGIKLENYDQVKQIVDAGLAPKIFAVGDQFVETWRDTAASKDYEYPFRVNHFENVDLQSGENVPGMFLQAHYAHPFGVQFSNSRAFLACPEGLEAGTYNIKFGANMGTHAKVNDYWSFTLESPVPAGGRIAGLERFPDIDPAKTGWKAVAYAADGKTKLETVTMSSGQTGTDLGVMQLSRREGNLNSMHEVAYGWNRWKTSALRQYLNSDKPKGEWWAPQDGWDIAPYELNSKDGYLRGMSEELSSILKTVKVTTYTNTVNDGGEVDTTYDKVFIPSLSQMHYVPQIEGEGSDHKYWVQRSDSVERFPTSKDNPLMVTYAVENHTSPQHVRLRSAHRGFAYYAWYVYSSGAAYYDYACYASRFAPLVVI